MSYNNKVNNALKFYLFIYTIQVISGILFPIYYSPSSNYLYLYIDMCIHRRRILVPD